MTTLADLKPGQHAVIESIDTSVPEVVRLMVLGLIEGVDICFQSAAIGGDPLEIGFYGTSLSLRREQARRFRVSPLDTRPA